MLLTGATWNNPLADLTILRHAVAGVEFNNADNGRTGNLIADSKIQPELQLGVQFLNSAPGSTVRNSEIGANLGEAILLWRARRARLREQPRPRHPRRPTTRQRRRRAAGVPAAENVSVARTALPRHRRRRPAPHRRLRRQPHRVQHDVPPNEQRRRVRPGLRSNQILTNTLHQESDGGIVLNGAAGTVTGNDLRFNPNGIETARTPTTSCSRTTTPATSSQSGFALGNGPNVTCAAAPTAPAARASRWRAAKPFAPDGVTPIGPATIEANTANENLEDGISVAAGGHTVTGNQAHNNAGYGVHVGRAQRRRRRQPGERQRPSRAMPVRCVQPQRQRAADAGGGLVTAPVTVVESGPPNGSNGFGTTSAFTATDDTTPPSAMISRST